MLPGLIGVILGLMWEGKNEKTPVLLSVSKPGYARNQPDLDQSQLKTDVLIHIVKETA